MGKKEGWKKKRKKRQKNEERKEEKKKQQQIKEERFIIEVNCRRVISLYLRDMEKN